VFSTRRILRMPIMFATNVAKGPPLMIRKMEAKSSPGYRSAPRSSCVSEEEQSQRKTRSQRRPMVSVGHPFCASKEHEHDESK
jgi:hypothetical protein